MITVVHKRLHKPTKNDVYIGLGSPLGNPYAKKESHLPHPNKIAAYKKWLLNRLADNNSDQFKEFYRIVGLAEKHDIYLVCYCKPLTCEGDFVKRLIENLIFPDER